ncbi:hypothetical protein J6590_091910 [Homalodisca vitripennis]|nr:hypothetical protein J6590_091910 [Homalodisca vitripennis]
MSHGMYWRTTIDYKVADDMWWQSERYYLDCKHSSNCETPPELMLVGIKRLQRVNYDTSPWSITPDIGIGLEHKTGVRTELLQPTTHAREIQNPRTLVERKYGRFYYFVTPRVPIRYSD